MSLTCQLSPAMPTPLLAAAPIVPAQWVPWPKSSAPPGEQLLFMQVRLSALSRLPWRSGCVKSIPVSMTTTYTSLALVWVSQVAGAAILVMSHCWLQSGSVGMATACWT